jgi:hypothetical protein
MYRREQYHKMLLHHGLRAKVFHRVDRIREKMNEAFKDDNNGASIKVYLATASLHKRMVHPDRYNQYVTLLLSAGETVPKTLDKEGKGNRARTRQNGERGSMNDRKKSGLSKTISGSMAQSLFSGATMLSMSITSYRGFC